MDGSDKQRDRHQRNECQNVFKRTTGDPSGDKALEIVNGQRADWGAWTNRLEHAKASDDNTSENTQASESRIRDADMADEMVRHSKHSILEQVGQTVLSQANQKKDMVLQLLQ